MSQPRIPTPWLQANLLAAGKDSNKILDYFARNGAPCAPDTNPAEHIIDVVQGSSTEKTDWVEVWNRSEECKKALEELEAMNESSRADPNYHEDTADYATSHWFQFKMVTRRLTVQIWRSPVRCPVVISADEPKLTGIIGLHVEQDHPSYLCSPLQWFHLLENGKRYFRYAAPALCCLQFHLRCTGLH